MNDLVVTNAPDTAFLAGAYLTKISQKSDFLQKQKVYTYLLSVGGSRLTTAFISTDLESMQAIQEYFKSSSLERKALRTITADSIKSVNSVFEVLAWSTKTGIKDAYDSAVDLLAECDSITLEVSRFAMGENFSEKKVATLISGIARAKHIPLLERLQVILRYCQSHKRMIKESVIESLALLADEVADDGQCITILPIVKFYLGWFASDKQPDQFIQRYAKDIIDELP